MRKLCICALFLASLTGLPWAHSGDKASAIFSAKGKLTADDPADSKFKDSKQKSHAVKLEAGKYIAFEVRAADFSPYLRLLLEDGKLVDEFEKEVSGFIDKQQYSRVV